MRFVLCLLLTFCLSALCGAQETRQEIRLVAAGSLTDAFNVMIADYSKSHPVHITATWGPSGVLRDSLEQGATFDIFASAALPHAQALTDKAISGPSILFVRNTLCAIVPATSTVTTGTLVDLLLKPETRLATSTPTADPGGDYTWRLFELIDHDHPGAYAALTGKAQQVFGGATTTTLVNGRHRLGLALDNGVADIVIYYCSWGHQATAEAGKYRMMPLPAGLAVGAEYGLTLSARAPAEAAGFAMYILSPAGQKTLKDFGFVPVALPQGE
jgi:molybdate transport system substrate-binding protein